MTVLVSTMDVFALLDLVELQHEALKIVAGDSITDEDWDNARLALEAFEEWNKP